MSFIETPAAFRSLVRKMIKGKEFAFDTETTGLNHWKEKLIGASVATDTKEGHFFMAPGIKQIVEFASMFKDPDRQYIGHNVKFDLHFLEDFGVKVKSKYLFDTYFLAKLVDENRPFIKGGKPYGLKPLAMDYFEKKSGASLDALQKWLAEHDKDMGQLSSVPKRILAKYGAEDARITLGLYRALRKQLKKDGIPDALIILEARVLRIAYDMERRGIKINVPFLKRYKKELAKERDSVLKKMIKMAKRKFNPNSDEELVDAMKAMGIKLTAKTEKSKKLRLDKYVLEGISHPFVDLLSEYRRVQIVLSTFVEGILERAVTKKGVSAIHCDYDTSKAVTGRWSCRNPNMQNVDKKSKAREAFVPRAGYELWGFDYKQIEPTIMAHLSNSYTLKEIFNKGKDWHSINAAIAFNVDIKKVTTEQRDKAKQLGLAIMYGAGAAKAGIMMKVPTSQAASMLKNFHAKFPEVKKLMNNTQYKIERTAKEAARACGRLKYNGKTGEETYDGHSMPDYKYVSKFLPREILTCRKGDEAPVNFNFEDPRKDNNWWKFEDWGRIEERGELTMFYGRKRRLTIDEAYKGLNSDIQGSAGLVLKEATVRAADALEGTKGFILLQVHDELVCELPKGPTGKKLAKLVKTAMESLSDIINDVPVVVDVEKSSKSWGHMKAVKL